MPSKRAIVGIVVGVAVGLTICVVVGLAIAGVFKPSSPTPDPTPTGKLVVEYKQNLYNIAVECVITDGTVGPRRKLCLRDSVLKEYDETGTLKLETGLPESTTGATWRPLGISTFGDIVILSVLFDGTSGTFCIFTYKFTSTGNVFDEKNFLADSAVNLMKLVTTSHQFISSTKICFCYMTTSPPLISDVFESNLESGVWSVPVKKLASLSGTDDGMYFDIKVIVPMGLVMVEKIGVNSQNEWVKIFDVTKPGNYTEVKALAPETSVGACLSDLPRYSFSSDGKYLAVADTNAMKFEFMKFDVGQGKYVDSQPKIDPGKINCKISYPMIVTDWGKVLVHSDGHIFTGHVNEASFVSEIIDVKLEQFVQEKNISTTSKTYSWLSADGKKFYYYFLCRATEKLNQLEILLSQTI